MKLAIIVLGADLYFLLGGLFRPHYFALAYVWLSFLYPQGFIPDPVRSLPFPLLFACFGAVACLVGRKKFPRVSVTAAALAGFLIWVTCSTHLWAVLPELAALKWNWAIRSIALALFMPLFFRTRAEIESAILTMFFALFAHISTAGLKSLFGGGSYGSFATLIRDNSYLGESSTLATVIVLAMPLAAYIGLDSLCAGAIPFRKTALAGFSGIALAAMVGTSARTGLIALGVYLATIGRRLWQKVAVCAGVAVLALLAVPLMPSEWMDRMQTIGTYESDASAAGRIAVWKWSLGYVAQHPLGGGFDIYQINGLLTPSGGEAAGKAFHSIYFEVFGEHGVVGLALYLLIAGSTVVGLYRLSRAREDLPEWVPAMSRRLLSATLVFLAGGAFIGVAYQPIGYALFGLYLCLRQSVWETQGQEEAVAAA